MEKKLTTVYKANYKKGLVYPQIPATLNKSEAYSVLNFISLHYFFIIKCLKTIKSMCLPVNSSS